MFKHRPKTAARHIVSLSNKKMPARNPHPQKKPPLTHFLCLPLLTPTSTPQLQASLAHLKSVTEALQPAVEDANAGAGAGARTRPPQTTRPLVPPAAFRPLGTLHLTLGVMSLKEPARLQGALRLLEDLDLEGLLRGVSVGESSPEDMMAEESPLPLGRGQSTKKPPDRLEEESSISQNMPRFTPSTIDTPAAQATEGEDTTSTLTTLSKPISPPPISTSNQPPKPPTPNSPPSTSTSTPTPIPIPLTISLRGLSAFPAHSPSHATVLHTPPAASDAATRRLYHFCRRLLAHFQTAGYILPDPADRELTLHATLINTVYAKKKRVGKVTFDATQILRVFNERGGELTSSSPGTGSHDNDNVNGAFTFASGIPITRVQICEMGAQKLGPEEQHDDPHGLGERYVVVAEKSILKS